MKDLKTDSRSSPLTVCRGQTGGASRRHDTRRVRHGIAILESKRWHARSIRSNRTRARPYRRYLRTSIAPTFRPITGILTNRRQWRLYWQDAKSQSEHFLELDLPLILGVPGITPDLFSHKERQRGAHFFKVFLLMLRRESFLPVPDDARTFHEGAVAETRKWEARVADDLSGVVFRTIFPDLVKAVARNDPVLQEMRISTR